jgi:hypothetical protein
MGRYFRRPSPAMVIAIVALVSSFAGPAIADQASVIAAKLNGSKIKARSIPGSALRNNTITGKQVKESKLGKVPSAKKADSATNANSATNATNATNSSQLAGKPGSDYLLKTDTAADSSKLGGKAPNQYVSFGGEVGSGGTTLQGTGFTPSKGGTGSYSVSFPDGTFSLEPGGSCHFPVPSVIPFSASVKIATITSASCSGSGSGSFSVRIADAANAPVDSSFWFLAL